ncbi:uncharacterized protein LOC106130675 [Amyelois transitella]|uniref:uncharacterized protein LOC106130675 n=1 Tax=Amyelois transitella TaxID=680683 RepID=UPI00299069C6|nr:uncharacterized protein LOC106130675 [Amyelois transitella]
MGQDENLEASLAHIILCCVAGRGISRWSSRSFIHPGMHANFFIHGLLGLINFQSSAFGSDVSAAYKLSVKATRYLALPCLMADMYRGPLTGNDSLVAIHLASGLIPMLLAVSGKDNPHLGNLMVAANIISLVHFSVQNSRDWGYYTALAGFLAYFGATNAGHPIFYPIALAVMEYFAYRLYHYEPPPRR